MPNVFISHTQDTSDYARRLAGALRGTWRDSYLDDGRTRSGEPWEEVRAALKAADYFVVLLTQRAASSPWLLFELGAAEAMRKPVVSLILSDLSHDLLDYLERDRLYLDARGLQPEEAAERIKVLTAGAAG